MAMAPVNIRINPLGGAVCIAFVLCTFFYVFGLPEWVTHFSMKEERISMKELLSVSVELARRGGDQVREIRIKQDLEEKSKGKTREGADEMLTNGDIQSHIAIINGFDKSFPGLKVISEEHEKTPIDLANVVPVNKKREDVDKAIKTDQSIPKDQITVWIDPLDATQEYTENLLQYVTTMVCVAVNGQPTMGVIHKPFANNNEGETTWAWAGFGHSENLVKAEEKTNPETDLHRIIVSRSHKGNVETVTKEHLKNSNITGAGGAGYKTLEVIRGNQDAYVHTTLIKKWDICAGNAILNSLDGKMTTLKGDYIDYSATSNPKNEGGLLATVYQHDFYLKSFKAIADNPSQHK